MVECALVVRDRFGFFLRVLRTKTETLSLAMIESARRIRTAVRFFGTPSSLATASAVGYGVEITSLLRIMEGYPRDTAAVNVSDPLRAFAGSPNAGRVA